MGIAILQTEKRLLAIVETDGCAADGISVTTNCWSGRRMLRVEDHGKVAATFVDIKTSEAVRIVPCSSIRKATLSWGGGVGPRFECYLARYMVLPDEALFRTQRVELLTPVEKTISKMSKRAFCSSGGEEINNEREVVTADGAVLCLHCAGHGYYRTVP